MSDEGYNPAENKSTTDTKENSKTGQSGQSDGLPDTLDVTTLSPKQLDALSKSLGNEMNFVTQSFTQLKNVLSRLQQSLEAVKEIKPATKSRELSFQ